MNHNKLRDPFDNPIGFRCFLSLLIITLTLTLLQFLAHLPHPAAQGALVTSIYGVLFILMNALLFCLPRVRNASWNLIIILVLSLAARLILMPYPPSDDIYRYFFEGRVVEAGMNPYSLPPASPELAHLRGDTWSLINHPEHPAVYPPFMLLLLSWLAPLTQTVFGLKGFWILFDMGTLLMLMVLLKEQRLPERYSLWYGLNPLVLMAFAGEGHLDIVMIFFLVGALLARERNRPLLMSLFLGLAVGSKVLVLPMVPFFYNRNNWKTLFLTAFVVLVPFIPFLDGGMDIFQGLWNFGTQMAFNGPIHYNLILLGLPAHSASRACILLFISGGIFLWKTRQDTFRDTGRVCAWLLCCLPTLHFWYLTLLIPFLLMRPKMSWLILNGTLGFYFLYYSLALQNGSWSHHPLVFSAIFLPFWSAQLLPPLRVRLFPRFYNKPQTIAVIVPTLGDADLLPTCLESLRQNTRIPDEIWIIDGGEDTETPLIAEKYGAFFMRATGGRGGQIFTGVQSSKADILCVCHADSCLHESSLERILTSLQMHPYAAGGALGQRFKSRRPILRILEILNDFRATLLGISFGDQCQYFRRDALTLMKGYPRIPLMEDVEWSYRLKRAGDRLFLFGGALSSPRRWSGYDIFPKMVQVVFLVAYYGVRRLWKEDTSDFYEWYYGKPVP